MSSSTTILDCGYPNSVKTPSVQIRSHVRSHRATNSASVADRQMHLNSPVVQSMWDAYVSTGAIVPSLHDLVLLFCDPLVDVVDDREDLDDGAMGIHESTLF